MVSERDQSILDFEGSWWLYPGPKIGPSANTSV